MSPVGYRKELGAWGERLAASFLIKRGCKILGKNFNTIFGEIDLIAQDGDEILFVEVKTRSGDGFGYPEIAVDYKKISHLTKAANIYLDYNNLDNFWRLDVVSVEIIKTKKSVKIKWFKAVGS